MDRETVGWCDGGVGKEEAAGARAMVAWVESCDMNGANDTAGRWSGGVGAEKRKASS